MLELVFSFSRETDLNRNLPFLLTLSLECCISVLVSAWNMVRKINFMQLERENLLDIIARKDITPEHQYPNNVNGAKIHY